MSYRCCPKVNSGSGLVSSGHTTLLMKKQVRPQLRQNKIWKSLILTKLSRYKHQPFMLKSLSSLPTMCPLCLAMTVASSKIRDWGARVFLWTTLQRALTTTTTTTIPPPPPLPDAAAVPPPLKLEKMKNREEDFSTQLCTSHRKKGDEYQLYRNLCTVGSSLNSCLVSSSSLWQLRSQHILG